MISIIVPVYNVAPYLEKCLLNILNQTFTDFEVILIDDGSTDNSGEICSSFAKRDKRIIVYHTPNKGVSSARNLGLDKAKGELIAFIDSDDYIGENYLKNLYEAFIENNSDLVIGGEIKYLNDVFTPFHFPDKTFSQNCFSEMFSIYKIHKHSSPWGKLFKMSIIKDHSLHFNVAVHLGEDVIFVMEYLSYCHTVTLIESSEYYYLQRNNSLTKRINSFQSEYSGLVAFDKASDNLTSKCQLDDSAIFQLKQWSVIFYDRTKIAYTRAHKHKDDSLKFKNIDWKRLKDFKPYLSKKDRVLDSLLWNKQIWLFLLINSVLRLR